MFRSLTVYQLTQSTDYILERLPDALKAKPYAPPLQKQAKSQGFINPLGADTQEITYGANGGTLFCLRTDEKEVPAGAVREMVDALAAEKQAAGEEFNMTDRRLAKDEITESLLPGIPAKPKRTFAYIDSQLHMLFVGGNEEDADHFIETLGKALGGKAPVILLGLNDVDPCDKFTDWVKDRTLLGKHFTLGHQGALKYPNKEGGCGNINAKNEDFDSEEFVSLIEAGRQVCSIALEHEDIHFRLTSKLGIRNIKLGEAIAAETVDNDTGEPTTALQFAAFVPVMRDAIRLVEPLLGEWPKQELLDLRDSQEDAA